MAKTTGPLFSLTASGSVGKTITYSNWKGRPYVRRLVIPLNTMTTGQQKVRNAMRCLASAVTWAFHTTYVSPTATPKDSTKIAAVTPDGFAWNGNLVAKAIGTNLDAFDAMEAAWAALSANHAAWDTAADGLTPAMLPVPQVDAGGLPGTGLTSGHVFFAYRYGLFLLGIAAEPGAVPPVYVAS